LNKLCIYWGVPVILFILCVCVCVKRTATIMGSRKTLQKQHATKVMGDKGIVVFHIFTYHLCLFIHLAHLW